jgi:hypothetical protein
MPGEIIPSSFVEETLAKSRGDLQKMKVLTDRNRQAIMIPVTRHYLVALQMHISTLTGMLVVMHSELQKRNTTEAYRQWDEMQTLLADANQKEV